jgi:hypothetical protein
LELAPGWQLIDAFDICVYVEVVIPHFQAQHAVGIERDIQFICDFGIKSLDREC